MTNEQLAVVAGLALGLIVLGVALLVWSVSCLLWVGLRLGQPAGEGWLTFLLVVARLLYDVVADRAGLRPPVR